MDQATVKKLAKLARLHIAEDEIGYYEKALSKIFHLEEKLEEVDTTGVKPMYHSLEVPVYLREDAVTETNQRELMQSTAPKTVAGLYLVPKVIE